MNRRHVVMYLCAFAAGALWVAAYTAAFDRHQYPFAPDSSYYIEAGRSFADGDGFKVTAPIHDVSRDVELLRLWPPGFPMLIGSLSHLGVSAESAALITVRFSWALLPVLLLFALRPMMGARAALAVAALSLLSPGALQEGRIASTDIPFLDLSLASLGLLIRAARGNTNALWMWGGAGALAGAAYVFRNAGIALCAATAAAFGSAFIMRMTNWRTTVIRSAAWSGGVALIVAPLFIYNLVAFGSLQPYEMPDSTVGLIENLRTFLASQLFDLSSWEDASKLAWSGAALVLLVAPLLCVWVFLLWKSFNNADSTQRFRLILIVLYAVASAGIVVVARTKYEWGEAINVRHTLQCTWAILALTALSFASLRNAIPTAASVLRTIGIAMVGALFVARAAYAYGDYNDAVKITAAITAASGDIAIAAGDADVVVGARAVRAVLAKDKALVDAVRMLPNDAFIASNRADVLAITTRRAVRRIESTQNLESVAHAIRVVDTALTCERPIHVIVAADNALLRAHGIRWQDAVITALQPTLRPSTRSANWLLLHADRTRCAVTQP